jgi:hypothetical protein
MGWLVELDIELCSVVLCRVYVSGRLKGGCLNGVACRVYVSGRLKGGCLNGVACRVRHRAV